MFCATKILKEQFVKLMGLCSVINVLNNNVGTGVGVEPETTHPVAGGTDVVAGLVYLTPAPWAITQEPSVVDFKILTVKKLESILFQW